MAYLLPHLKTGYAVDCAIVEEKQRLVCIRFGHDWNPSCMQVFRSPLLSTRPIDGRLSREDRWCRQELRCHLLGGHFWSSRFQSNVWIKRWCDPDVLLRQQPDDDRSRNRQQQQDQLALAWQGWDDCYHGDHLSRCNQGQDGPRVSLRLFYTQQVLSLLLVRLVENKTHKRHSLKRTNPWLYH